MSLTRVGPKKLRRVQAAVGDEATVLRAVAGSHWDQFWVWHFVTADHRHGWYDSRSGEWAYYAAAEVWHTSACAEFPDREERFEAQWRRDEMERLKRRVDRARAGPPQQSTTLHIYKEGGQWLTN